MVKMTFSLDDGTVAQVRETAARLARPQSPIVRDAVAECVLGQDATLWTLNPDDFEDVPGLRLLS
jgi:predicted transcriptional regulator